MPEEALLVVAACACWAIDANLTRKISINDAMLIGCLKGLVDGAVYPTTALSLEAHLASMGKIGDTMLTGFACYGTTA